MVVKPPIKQPNLDPDVLGSYRPVSNLLYLSQILERTISEQLRTHLDANNLQIRFPGAARDFFPIVNIQ